MSEQRTLCHRCANNYRDAGYYLIRDYTVIVKDACDVCGRAGWQYWLVDERDRRVDKTLR